MGEDHSDPVHWDGIYRKRAPDGVSWYTPHLRRSLSLIQRVAPSLDARIIDVGGGASTLVDDLLRLGYQNLTVLDLSAAALEVSQARLGPRAVEVDWRVGDVTTIALPEHEYTVWHDRAVFHFLTRPEARTAYVRQTRRSLRPDGLAIVATFGPQGPERCSGLPVVRYDPDGLHAEFGPAFEKLESVIDVHETPFGTEQEFLTCLCRVHG